MAASCPFLQAILALQMSQTTAGHQYKQEDDFDECEHCELDELARPSTTSSHWPKATGACESPWFAIVVAQVQPEPRE